MSARITKADVIRLRDAFLREHSMSFYDLLLDIEGTYAKSISPALQLYFNFPSDGDVAFEDLAGLIELRGTPGEDNGHEICQQAKDLFSGDQESLPLLALQRGEDGALLKATSGDRLPDALLGSLVKRSWELEDSEQTADCHLIASWILSLG